MTVTFVRPDGSLKTPGYNHLPKPVLVRMTRRIVLYVSNHSGVERANCLKC